MSPAHKRLRPALVPVAVAVVEDRDDLSGAFGGGRPQTAEGFADLVDAVEDEVGTTEVFEAVIYPEYAVVDVPLKPGDEREISYHWDGDLSESTKGTSDYVPFDLANVDGSLLEGLCDQAEELVEDPRVCYLIVRRPRENLDEGWLWAYTNNEFSQGGYISFDLEGNEVSGSTW
jgi:hypothetical protein